MLYLIFQVYDDFSSFGKIPVLLKRTQESAIAYCKLLNSDLKIDWIDDQELNGNPGERSSGFFYEEIEIDED